MRVDKYLWCIRVFKTRSISTAACKAEKVWVNGEFVKASRELKLKDVVRVRKGPIHFQFEVIDFPKSRLGAKLVPTVTKDVTEADELAKLDLWAFPIVKNHSHKKIANKDFPPTLRRQPRRLSLVDASKSEGLP
jgi:ribosome-associated heat shock protein Hsp15